jgi:hypothetical protein
MIFYQKSGDGPLDFPKRPTNWIERLRGRRSAGFTLPEPARDSRPLAVL